MPYKPEPAVGVAFFRNERNECNVPQTSLLASIRILSIAQFP